MQSIKTWGRFGIYDIMRQKDGELTYPVQWSADSITSKLSTHYHYIQALQQAGFKVFQENNRRHFALDLFKQLRVKAEVKEGLPPLGLHILMQENTAIKLQNMVKNIKADLIAPVEIIAKKL
jgi:hypothetical protein